MMRVVIVDTTMTTPPTGGAHTFLVDICAPLVARGWQVTFITQAGPEQSVVRALREAGGEVVEGLWPASALPEERAESIAAWVNGARPDAYVISTSPDAGWLALPLLETDIPTLSIAHNDVGAYYEPLKHYGEFIDRAVGVSREIHRRIIEECGIPPERARRIPYGVEPLDEEEARAGAESSLEGGPLRVGYVGRLVQEQKRVLEMAPLAAELIRRGVDFELHVVGEGSARAALEAELARRGAAGRVKFWGWLPSAEVKRRLKELDVFLLMSDYEGLSVALLEALGHALAPVVTGIKSGTGEVVVDGRNGFVVPVGDIRQFAERLEQLAHDRQLLASLRAAAWEACQPYTIERMADAYARCLAEARVINSTRAARPRPRPDFPVMPACRSTYPFWLRKLKRRVLAAAGRGR